ncbi:LysR family transcriptional regulator [Pandoraea communis]|uniref:LysR family transcriptional regulator n=1 Tax=Pandoraea communis TaxID=2508297 RepID=A0A5E4U6Y1_9BURK|nr:LysR family transcriptional regulator [Pandoraea communis]VVD95775.1 LysR family transcriptional regulator [Pandoraea communis]
MIGKLDGVDVFVQVVEAGSFTEAAERLHITRSAVGKVVTRLEARLGTRLLHRTTRNQALTEAGRAYYDRCVRALAELHAGEAELESGASEPRGRLRVSAPTAFGHRCVAPVLFALTRKHPELQVHISFSDRAVDLVEEGFDLAVRIGDVGGAGRLASRRIGVQNQSIGAAPSYLAQHGAPVAVEDFARHVGVTYARAGAVMPWTVLEPDGMAKALPICGQLSMDDVQAIADAGRDGLGLVQLPCWLLSHYVTTGELVAVRERCAARPLDIHVVWPDTPYLPSKTRFAIEALATQIPPSRLD